MSVAGFKKILETGCCMNFKYYNGGCDHRRVKKRLNNIDEIS